MEGSGFGRSEWGVINQIPKHNGEQTIFGATYPKLQILAYLGSDTTRVCELHCPFGGWFDYSFTLFDAEMDDLFTSPVFVLSRTAGDINIQQTLYNMGPSVQY